ncbi:MAG TPA: acetylxylan esterase [Abditibacteriaceae bacterium]|jgi:cephalosporin-C deacetylase
MFAHDFPFDPTYGYSQAQLQQIRPPSDIPHDFDEFWRATFAESSAVPLQLKTEPAASPGAGWTMNIVRYNTLGGMRVGAWVLAPTDASCIRRGFVVGHGYGGRAAPQWPLPLDDAAYIFPCAPGFDLSAAPNLPNNAAQHVVFGIASRDTYLLRACVASLWAAATVLIELYPAVATSLSYSGESFGGGLGALMLPWDERFRRAHLVVPTFGHHPLRLQCPCVGSGEAVRELHAQQPGIIHMLRYYDAAVAAQHITTPTLCVPALFDPAVPPPGQFAVANALSGEHEIFILSGGHFDYIGQEEERQQAQQRFQKWFR